MATTLQVGWILTTQLWSLFGDQAAVNTYHWHVDSVGGAPSTDQDLGDTVQANVVTPYRALLANGVTYKGIVTQAIWPLPASVAVHSVVGAGIGTGGAGELPLQVSGIISWYTSTAGRHGRGRSYIPFPSTNANDSGAGGIPTNAYVTALDTYAAALGATLSLVLGGRTANVSRVLYDRATHGFTFVTTRASRQKWATQRRRGDYGRPNSSPL